MNVQDILLSSIKAGENSRLNVDQDDLSQLMASIEDIGLLSPIGIHRDGKSFKVIFGNRRLQAFQKLGRHEIPAVILPPDATEDDLLWAHLAENLQRKDLSPAEEGKAYLELINSRNLKRGELAELLNISKNRVDSAINVINRIPEEYHGRIASAGNKRRVRRGKIPVSVANKLVGARSLHRLTKANMGKLFEAATKNPRHVQKNLAKHIAAIKQGVTFSEASGADSYTFRVTVSKKEIRRINRTYIKSGVAKSFAGVARQMLSGKIKDRMKLEEVIERAESV